MKPIRRGSFVLMTSPALVAWTAALVKVLADRQLLGYDVRWAPQHVIDSAAEWSRYAMGLFGLVALAAVFYQTSGGRTGYAWNIAACINLITALFLGMHAWIVT